MTEEENSDVVKEGDFIVTKQKKGHISEFFNHMITYGGFSFNNGIMKVWGDTSFFIPVDGLIIYYNELKKQLDITANDIFYWLGHLYGRNSSLMLIKKFGFDKKKVSDFVNGATQDGFGYMSVIELKYNNKRFLGDVEGTNSNFSTRYQELFGKQNMPLDFYIGGILAGGSEPLFNFNIKTTEEKCIGKGDKSCIYKLESTKDPNIPSFFKEIELSENDIRKKTELLGQKRNIKFKIFGKKDIKFGDGSFILKGYKGFNFASYELVLLDLFSLKLLGEKKFYDIKEKVAQAYIDNTENPKLSSKIIATKQIENLLEHMKIFGFGHLSLYRFQKNTILIKNEENPYVGDQINLFKKAEKTSLDFLTRLFRISFKKYFDKDIVASSRKISFKESFIEIKL
jgi:predicted hydrocarbon binding protein